MRFRTENNELQTVKLDNVSLKFFTYYGVPYFSAADIFKFLDSKKNHRGVKENLLAGIDYVKMDVRNVSQYFVTPTGIVKITQLDGAHCKEHLKMLYAFFTEKYRTVCPKQPENFDEPRKCLICGKLLPKTASSRQKYCSVMCNHQAKVEQARIRERVKYRNTALEKKCPHCGTTFYTHEDNKIFCCASCRKLYDMAHRKKAEQAPVGEDFILTQRVCPVCGTTFTPHAHNQVACSSKCSSVISNIKRRSENSATCKYCGTVFTPKKKKEQFCCRDCEVKYYRRKNFFHAKDVYPDAYRYYVKFIEPKTKNFLTDEPTTEELKKPEYQRKNSILMCLDPYPV